MWRYMQKIMDAMGESLNTLNIRRLLNQSMGRTIFFSTIPLKYNGWQEYQTGVVGLSLRASRALRLTFNDDRAHHRKETSRGLLDPARQNTLTTGGKHEMALCVGR